MNGAGGCCNLVIDGVRGGAAAEHEGPCGLKGFTQESLCFSDEIFRGVECARFNHRRKVGGRGGRVKKM